MSNIVGFVLMPLWARGDSDETRLEEEHCLMATREEIEQLKQSWCQDPIWDLAETEGFEEHAEELAAYQAEMEAYWKSQREKETQERAIELGCSPQMARYIIDLEYRIENLQEQVKQAITMAYRCAGQS